jgi:hypothetical protein
MSRPVTARLAPFSRSGGPSVYDQALVASVPPVVLTSVASISAASLAGTPSVPIYWATISTATTISLGTVPTATSYLSGSLQLNDSTLYNPMDAVYVSTVSSSDVVVLQDGVYSIRGQSYASLSEDLVGAADGIALDAYVNGTPVRRLELIRPPIGSTLSADAGIQFDFEFMRPLVAGTTVSLYYSAFGLSTGGTIKAGLRTFNTGAECYITRVATLVHATPQ